MFIYVVVIVDDKIKSIKHCELCQLYMEVVSFVVVYII